MPKVLASSGTMGTILLPISGSLSKSVIILTIAMVVEIFRSPLDSSSFSKGLSLAIESGSDEVLLLGINPPNASLVFLRYCISGESSGGLTYGNFSISESGTGILNLSRKDFILSIDNFFTWWVVLSASLDPVP